MIYHIKIMDSSIIIRPLIGAAIGYVTNWIAVKMMFRPLEPVKLGKFTLPFTPGIIPKNKEKLSKAIGNTISGNLLNEETLKDTLLSEEMKQEIREKVIETLNSVSDDNSLTVQEFICKYVEEDSYNLWLEKVSSHLSSNIYKSIVDYNIGKLVADQIELSAKEKLKGSVLGIFGGNSIVSSISETATLKINDYIETNGEDIIKNMVISEIEKYTNYKMSDISENLANSDINLVHRTMSVYEEFIIKKVPQILGTLNISKIVTEKINSMSTLQLEKLILNIMKKELNALVNLGAIIGFILGLLNLFF